jgi:protein SCO1
MAPVGPGFSPDSFDYENGAFKHWSQRRDDCRSGVDVFVTVRASEGVQRLTFSKKLSLQVYYLRYRFFQKLNRWTCSSARTHRNIKFRITKLDSIRPKPSSAGKLSPDAFVLAIWIALTVAGCNQARQPDVRRFDISGIVVAVESERAEVTLEHKEIPGYMSAMTMPFKVRDTWALSVLQPGQSVRASLVVDGERSWLEQISITEPASGAAGGAPASTVLEAEAGSEVPDVRLVDQDGAPVSLRQFRGRILLLTFIYTRCPLPDYCPRMSRNFAEIHKAILGDPALKGRCSLLSISFDPDHDTPSVLKNYGAPYTLRESKKPFESWSFATGTHEEIRKAAAYFGLTYSPDGSTITHSLRTALVGADGRLIRIYHGNDWSPAEVVDQIGRSIPSK